MAHHHVFKLFRNVHQIRLHPVRSCFQGRTQHNRRFPILFKPLLFTVATCGVSFALAPIVEYELSQRSQDRNHWPVGRRGFSGGGDSPWQTLKQFWDSKSAGFKVFAGLFMVNGVVFILWRLPLTTSFMMRHFVSQVGSDASVRLAPMILSNFSHFSLTHLAMNMFVLYSFSNVAVYLFGWENFLALYMSAGVMSSFTSLVHKVAINSLSPSLGASGAILGILGACCLERPDMQMMVVFFPFFTFTSLTALKGLLIFDTLGVILRWEFFDHAAHLGGTLFGMYYVQSLREYLKRHRSAILRRWKQIRDKV